MAVTKYSPWFLRTTSTKLWNPILLQEEKSKKTSHLLGTILMKENVISVAKGQFCRKWNALKYPTREQSSQGIVKKKKKFNNGRLDWIHW